MARIGLNQIEPSKPLLDGTNAANGTDPQGGYDPGDKNLITAPRTEPLQEGELGWDVTGATYIWHDFGWRPWRELYPNNPPPKNPTHLLDSSSGRLLSDTPLSDVCVFFEESLISIRREVNNVYGLGAYNQQALTQIEARLDKIEKLLTLVPPPNHPDPFLLPNLGTNISGVVNKILEEGRKAKEEKEFAEARRKQMLENHGLSEDGTER